MKSGNVRDLGSGPNLRPDQGNLVIVNGSIFYKEGTSLGGAKVEIESVDADGSTKNLTNVYTNVQGEFIYKRPQSGTMKLRLKPSSRRGRNKESRRPRSRRLASP